MLVALVVEALMAMRFVDAALYPLMEVKEEEALEMRPEVKVMSPLAVSAS